MKRFRQIIFQLQWQSVPDFSQKIMELAPLQLIIGRNLTPRFSLHQSVESEIWLKESQRQNPFKTFSLGPSITREMETIFKGVHWIKQVAEGARK